ncbi:HAD family hydrolase [Pseudonocardia hydrocarbonoxydans]|uniref:Phosphoglycolate phosphatase n=1 Tax=Pseudonocardia hydrocarbonoxydans TaxID=76726 RepID=A0A4Y3WGP4_9PSEU|nr:HAD family phosphatase [Pseudonocardia hydrocarbonoxydans]GEC18043.1 phosphoglycolate phosphatase [Pseudonocardia hydrocarbonoxydans]
MSTTPAAVLWDMDGTLVDSEKVWTVSLADTARALGGALSAGAREAIIGSNLPRTLGIMFDDLGLPPDADRMAEAERMILRRTGELFRAGLEWRPGAQAALRAVRAAGWPTALVTNTGRELTELALDGIGREHFTVSVCGDEVPRGKPDPDPYLRAAELLGVDAADCLAVEDSPTGALAAERAGAAVLVVPCEIPVPDGPGRVRRASLVGLTPEGLRADYARARGRDAA